MAETTHISWADATFNPVLGCTKVSNGPLGACVNCYAEVLVDQRFGRAQFGGLGKGVGTRVRTSDANWKQPLAWNRKAARDGTRPFVFCASLADVFDNTWEPAWRSDLFDLIRATPNLVWLLLTKRPQNIAKLFAETITPKLRDAQQHRLGLSLWPQNAAIGCTVVTQEEADRDIPVLLAAKAALKPTFAFVSMEPLMGPVDLTRISTMQFRGAEVLNALTGELTGMFGDPCPTRLLPLDWCITGGESGPNARPTDARWLRALRDQCASAGTAFQLKQNGEHVSGTGSKGGWVYPVNGDRDTYCWSAADVPLEGGWFATRVGKKAAGRTLDGVIWDQRPNV